MSKTSIKERNKAIRLAWERKQKLVAEGKGTRDWSQDQQKDILDPVKGKAYDENGRAFEGQHMKSAAEYPEYQGDPDNIQFLTREEHLEAHKGSWKNSTNWYYHPETKEFVDFGENKPIPCEANYLSEPVCSPVINSHYKNDNLKEPSKAEAESRERVKPLRQEDAAHHLETKSQSKTMVPTPEVHESFVDKVLRAVDAAKEFSERHPILIEIVKVVADVVLVNGVAAVASKFSGGGGSSEGNKSDSSSSDLVDDYSGQADDNDDGDDCSDLSGSRDYPDERSSPREHDVSGYDRQQNGKTVHVNPYKRGGRHNDD
ncbi:teneurin-3 [Bilifractor sp. LCP21S3_A7]|uniref:teneurin-3 n=1 Tax=Bilifractor sp. LCP21S3_A7 TaxID=3438738 RepID=UPI003F92E06F